MTTSTKDRLLHAAAELIWAQGYAATGLNAVLKKAGAASASLYHFFSSKEELLLAVLEAYREAMPSRIFAVAFERTADPIERVFAVLEVYREHLEAHGCALGCPIGNLAAELSDSLPEVRAKVAELFRFWVEQIEGCLDAAADRLPADVDRHGLAQLVLTVMEGSVMQARALRSLEPFDASVANLRRFFDLLVQERSNA